MSYVTENLDPNESILFRASIHWAAYLGSFILLLIGVSLWVATQHVGFLLFFGVISVLRILSIRSRELAVTDRKVIGKVGVIRRNTLELRHNQLEGLNVNQGILGRLLGYGNITVCGTGGSKLGLAGIADPLKVRTEVNTATESASPRMLRPAA